MLTELKNFKKMNDFEVQQYIRELENEIKNKKSRVIKKSVDVRDAETKYRNTLHDHNDAAGVLQYQKKALWRETRDLQLENITLQEARRELRKRDNKGTHWWNR